MMKIEKEDTTVGYKLSFQRSTQSLATTVYDNIDGKTGTLAIRVVTIYVYFGLWLLKCI